MMTALKRALSRRGLAAIWSSADTPADPLATCWQLRGISGRVHTCSVFRPNAPGLILRVEVNGEWLKTKCVADIDVARTVADDWRRTLLETGVFEEVG